MLGVSEKFVTNKAGDTLFIIANEEVWKYFTQTRSYNYLNVFEFWIIKNTYVAYANYALHRLHATS